jgi:hypothetical protein
MSLQKESHKIGSLTIPERPDFGLTQNAGKQPTQNMQQASMGQPALNMKKTDASFSPSSSSKENVSDMLKKMDSLRKQPLFNKPQIQPSGRPLKPEQEKPTVVDRQFPALTQNKQTEPSINRPTMQPQMQRQMQLQQMQQMQRPPMQRQPMQQQMQQIPQMPQQMQQMPQQMQHQMQRPQIQQPQMQRQQMPQMQQPQMQQQPLQKMPQMQQPGLDSKNDTLEQLRQEELAEEPSFFNDVLDKVKEEAKVIVLLFAIILICTLPQLDSLITSNIPALITSDSSLNYGGLAIKALLMAILFSIGRQQLLA